MALLQLLLKAGPGVDTLVLDVVGLEQLEVEVVPLLAQPGAGVRALCTTTSWRDEWCVGFLKALPACVAHAKLNVRQFGGARRIRALVQGGVEGGLRHAVWLTLLDVPVEGCVTELEEELQRMAAGTRSGGGGEGQLLTIEVVRAR